MEINKYGTIKMFSTTRYDRWPHSVWAADSETSKIATCSSICSVHPVSARRTKRVRTHCQSARPTNHDRRWASFSLSPRYAFVCVVVGFFSGAPQMCACVIIRPRHATTNTHTHSHWKKTRIKPHNSARPTTGNKLPRIDDDAYVRHVRNPYSSALAHSVQVVAIPFCVITCDCCVLIQVSICPL